MRPGEIDVTALPACEGSTEPASLDAVASLSRQATDPHSTLNTASGSGPVLGVSVVGAYSVGSGDGTDDDLGDSFNGSLEQSPGGRRGEEEALRLRVNELETALAAESSKAEALASQLDVANEQGGERALVDLQMEISGLRKERDDALATVERLVAENAELLVRIAARDEKMIARSEADAMLDAALHTSTDQSLGRETELVMQLASIKMEKEEMARYADNLKRLNFWLNFLPDHLAGFVRIPQVCGGVGGPEGDCEVFAGRHGKAVRGACGRKGCAHEREGRCCWEVAGGGCRAQGCCYGKGSRGEGEGRRRE